MKYLPGKYVPLIYRLRYWGAQLNMRSKWLFNAIMWITIIYVIVNSSIVILRKRFTQQSIPILKDPHHEYTRKIRSSVTKMVFLGYSRGGSSISSEIFDIDDRAIFWYEPLEAFYFSKTGYYGRKDQKVLMNKNETNFRYINPWEYEGITTFFTDLFDCRLSRLPTEFQAHRFMKHNTAIEKYVKCYQQLSPDNIIDDLDLCRENLQNVCGKTVGGALENKCLELMDVVHHTIHGRIDPDDVKYDLIQSGFSRRQAESVIGQVVSYKKCLDQLETISDSCIHLAEESCRSKKLRTMKIIRLTLNVAQTIMRAIPDMLITIFIRDPRAIAYSRAGKEKTEFDILNNLKLTCRKMETDINAALDIEKKYPGSVNVLKYEDFVQDPYYWAEEMYKHTGYTTPTLLDEFIQTHMFAGETDGKKWGNIRPNATEIAFRWHQMVSLGLVEKMQTMCGHLIAKLGYPIF